MAINTDASFEKSALGGREVSNPTNFQDTEKLLSSAVAEPSGQTNLKAADSLSVDHRGSMHSLNAEQIGQRSPLRSGSMGTLSTAPKSSSRISLGQLSSMPQESRPPTYFWVALLSCLCPAVPVNICALWYALVSKTVLQAGDVEGAKKYGRLSLFLSVVSIILGVVVIILLAIYLEKSQ